MGEAQTYRGSPVELVDCILDRFDPETEEGRKTLASCSIASRSLSVFGQKRIFYSTRITLRYELLIQEDRMYEDEHTTGKRLLDLLNESPHLAVYIQRFTVVFARQHASISNYGALVSLRSPLFSLYGIVPKLTELKAFAIHRQNHIFWKDLGPMMHSLLHEVVQTRALDELDLFAIEGAPDTILSKCSSLTALHANSIEIKTDEKPSKQASLDLLHYSECLSSTSADLLQMFDSPFSPLSFRHLRKLIVTLPDPSAIRGLLSFCSGTLEHLEIWSLGLWREHTHMAYQSPNTVPVLDDVVPDLGGLHRLRDVVICARVSGYGRRGFYFTDVPYACALLSTLPVRDGSPACIRASLNINIRKVPTDNLQDIQWSELIGVNLVERRIHAIFANLDIRFRICQDGFMDLDRPDLLPVVERDAYLTRLRELGLATSGLYVPKPEWTSAFQREILSWYIHRQTF